VQDCPAKWTDVFGGFCVLCVIILKINSDRPVKMALPDRPVRQRQPDWPVYSAGQARQIAGQAEIAEGLNSDRSEMFIVMANPFKYSELRRSGMFVLLTHVTPPGLRSILLV